MNRTEMEKTKYVKPFVILRLQFFTDTHLYLNGFQSFLPAFAQCRYVNTSVSTGQHLTAFHHCLI